MSAKQAGSAHLSSVAGKNATTRAWACPSEPIYPAWFEEHITGAEKKVFKEYAAAKVKKIEARQSLASSSRQLVIAQTHFHKEVKLAQEKFQLAREKLQLAREKFQLAREKFNDKRRSTDSIRSRIHRAHTFERTGRTRLGRCRE